MSPLWPPFSRYCVVCRLQRDIQTYSIVSHQRSMLGDIIRLGRGYMIQCIYICSNPPAQNVCGIIYAACFCKTLLKKVKAVQGLLY